MRGRGRKGLCCCPGWTPLCPVSVPQGPVVTLAAGPVASVRNGYGYSSGASLPPPHPQGWPDAVHGGIPRGRHLAAGERLHHVLVRVSSARALSRSRAGGKVPWRVSLTVFSLCAVGPLQ